MDALATGALGRTLAQPDGNHQYSERVAGTTSPTEGWRSSILLLWGKRGGAAETTSDLLLQPVSSLKPSRLLKGSRDSTVNLRNYQKLQPETPTLGSKLQFSRFQALGSRFQFSRFQFSRFKVPVLQVPGSRL